MVAGSLYAVDGPDKPALQWALLYPERGQTVTFKIGEDIVEARISEMEEIAGLEFNLRGSFASGSLKGAPFKGFYSIKTRTGTLQLDDAD
ncbi:hypothetical protein [Hyphomicrobium sp.]|uniref:hypothetical protein n=1 Tax=Hyphomicrobium sp. TaxID=82 RepID=UPI002FDEC61A